MTNERACRFSRTSWGKWNVQLAFLGDCFEGFLSFAANSGAAVAHHWRTPGDYRRIFTGGNHGQGTEDIRDAVSSVV